MSEKPSKEAASNVAAPAASAEKKSPEEWAAALGLKLAGPRGNGLADQGTVKMLSVRRGSANEKEREGLVAYHAARVLHGWGFHEDHEGGPIQLTQADFVAALKAALPAEGNPVPHKPALYTRRLVRFGES